MSELYRVRSDVLRNRLGGNRDAACAFRGYKRRLLFDQTFKLPRGYESPRLLQRRTEAIGNAARRGRIAAQAHIVQLKQDIAVEDESRLPERLPFHTGTKVRGRVGNRGLGEGGQRGGIARRRAANRGANLQRRRWNRLAARGDIRRVYKLIRQKIGRSRKTAEQRHVEAAAVLRSTRQAQLWSGSRGVQQHRLRIPLIGKLRMRRDAGFVRDKPVQVDSVCAGTEVVQCVACLKAQGAANGHGTAA